VVGTGVSLSATKGARTASWTGLIKDGLSYCTALDPKLSSTWAEGKRAGISRITPHGLRHTGNDLLRRFASREVVMSITGHSTPTMHSHCSHVDAGEKAAAVGKVIELVTKRAPSDQQRGEFLDPDKLPLQPAEFLEVPPRFELGNGGLARQEGSSRMKRT